MRRLALGGRKTDGTYGFDGEFLIARPGGIFRRSNAGLSALAQAGTNGGTIGKQDKSISNQRALPVMARRWTCGVDYSYAWLAGVLSWG
jgi:hypothetical protein